MTERAKKRCGIITPFGVFIPQRMPFGLKTSPAGFCYVMHLILSGLAFAQYYMDDIIVDGKDEAELTKNLITVFEKLNAGNLKIQLSKVQFFESELKLLGVVFSKAGKKIDPVKVQTITECPEPKTVKQLQRFLGMVNFVSDFILHYATSMYPLYQLLKKSEKTFTFSEEGKKAIQEIKSF